MGSPPEPLEITIIGAGIAGFTCALALRQNGHIVTLLEKSKFHQETGAAMYVSPNCSGLLMRLGWQPETCRAVVCAGFASYDGETVELKAKSDMAEARRQWGSPWMLVHRIDLHNELKRMVLLPEGEGTGKTVELFLGVTIENIDAENAMVRLSDGKVFNSDAIIGADGNNSVARKCVEPEAHLKPWGTSCYRWMVERDVLLNDAETAQMINAEGWFGDFCGRDRKFVMYPCRDNTVYNFAAFLPDHETASRGDDWDQEGSKTKLEKGFNNFSAAARKLLAFAGDDLNVWQLVDLQPLKHWVAGRLALLGDAAHPFLPFLGQGAAQAMEDAISVAVLLQPGTTGDEAPALLKLYESIRKDRVDYVQEQTRMNGLNEDEGRTPPSELFKMLDFCHKHDEWRNTSERLREWRSRQPAVN